MGALSKEAILAKTDDLGLEKAEVPEWGGEVFVRGMRGVERDSFEASMFEGEGDSRKRNLANLRARLLVRCLVDDKGARLFEDADAAELGLRNAKVLDRLYDIACALSGIGPNAVEAAAKN